MDLVKNINRATLDTFIEANKRFRQINGDVAAAQERIKFIAEREANLTLRLDEINLKIQNIKKESTSEIAKLKKELDDELTKIKKIIEAKFKVYDSQFQKKEKPSLTIVSQQGTSASTKEV